MARLLLVLLMLVATAASARMYEWRNPRTGSVQYAGVPPAWYRSAEGGPRVRVYESGKLIDDTAIELSEEESREMRDAAFIALEQRQQLDAIKRLERAARREAARQKEVERAAALARGEILAEEQEQALVEAPEVLDAAMVERLKAIISAYDQAAETTEPPVQVPGSSYVVGPRGRAMVRY